MMQSNTMKNSNNRKRSRSIQKQQRFRVETMTWTCLVLAIVFAASGFSKASAMSVPPSAAPSYEESYGNDDFGCDQECSLEEWENEECECEDYEEDEEDEEDDLENFEEECFDEECDFDDECFDEECDDEDFEDDEEYDEDDEENDLVWTPEQVEEMHVLYERYLEKVAEELGPNWQDEYEIEDGLEEIIYERYLEFQERKLQEAEANEEEKLREMNRSVKAYHQALRQYDANEAAVTKEHSYYFHDESDEGKEGGFPTKNHTVDDKVAAVAAPILPAAGSSSMLVDVCPSQ